MSTQHLPSASGAVIAMLVTAALAACASDAVQPGVPRVVKALPITPFAVHEECLKLAPGDRLDYAFTTTAPVAFNIHYHEGKTVVMPISRDDTRADSGIYAPSLAQDYCLMWEAGREGVLLDYRVRWLPDTTR